MKNIQDLDSLTNLDLLKIINDRIHKQTPTKKERNSFIIELHTLEELIRKILWVL